MPGVRACEPRHEGYVEREGVRIWFEIYGAGETTILLIPGWTMPLRSWKAQIPYLSRHFRVIAFDPRGTGRSDRPEGTSAYALREYTADIVAVLDEVGAGSVVVLAKSRGAQVALALAGDRPATVQAVIVAAPFVPLSPWPPLDSIWTAFDQQSSRQRRRSAVRASLSGGWQLIRSRDLRRFSRRVNPLEAADRFSRQSMLDDFDGFARWFAGQLVATDAHSTKQTEDLVAWVTSTGSHAAADAFMGDCIRDRAAGRALCAQVTQPVLVVHGDCDLAVPFEWGTRLAELTGGSLFVVPGAGHLVQGRFPVLVNLAIREFVDSLGSGDDGSTQDQSGAAPWPA